MKKDTNYKKVKLELDDVMEKILAHLAKARGVSRSRLINDAIREGSRFNDKRIPGNKETEQV